MKHKPIPKRNILFLQGPPGPFFWLLAQRLKDLGHGIHRINLNGGDAGDWPGEAVDYRGPRRRWTLFIDRYLCDHAITDLVLFGDCRPMHMAAHQMAKLRDIDVHVFEEGYIRPNWVTLEPSGVNGHSSLPRDPAWFREQARTLPPVPDRPPITASFDRRAHDAYWYFHRMIAGRILYPFHRSHRDGSQLMEGFGWGYKFLRARREAAATARALEAISGKPYFLFPLQLSNDYQIKDHSPFATMAEAMEYVVASFARRAAPDTLLVIKEHPLDCSFASWAARIRRCARLHRLDGRLIHIAGGDLDLLSRGARGMVTINSTSATLALKGDVPTIALGAAIYSMPGITHQGRLDEFWRRPQGPDPATYEAFRRVLYDRCLVYGGFASKSAVETLIESVVERLTARAGSPLEPISIVPFG